MAERTVVLFKKSGGCEITGPDGEQYTWAKDGDGVTVPYEWALELLGIPGGGFYTEGMLPEVRAGVLRYDGSTVSTQPTAAAGLTGSEEGHHAVVATATVHSAASVEEEDAEVTEPAPKDEHEVTEPDPDEVRKVTEPRPAPKGAASPVTPRPRGATQKR